MNVAIIPLMLVGLLFSLIPVVGLVVLQVFLSKMEEDWPGLILPILSGSVSLLLSLLFILNIVRGGSAIIVFIVAFVLINIPTVVFMLIYKSVHKKHVSTREIDKMTIQDLG